ncbi:DUF6427 family protein [Aequorivita echinoideorum]|uniref:UbiA prenyltransferase family protein n=1 Tax=Aequorivita echinoideorum TaxID=1549647 RepID=A0ABS5S1T4_9FLAO|nr:DUF6427 family protein [Aequorivita echinoideorum]MBT0607172.1 hypothetical protein [Aequorivita echinoideorum]
MLTSFFGKSNPVNYLILGIFIALGYLFTCFFKNPVEISVTSIVINITLMAVAVLSMLLLDFIIRKNDITRTNTYAILFFTFFLLVLPQVFLAPKILLATGFLLLALRRIISLRTDKNAAKKILDASIWITVASFFQFYTLLFFIPLWIAIIQKPNSDYKQMLMPITGFVGTFLICTAYHFLVEDSFQWFFNWKEKISFDFSAYNSLGLLLPAAIIFAFVIWTGVNRGFRFSTLSTKEKPTYLLLFYCLLVSIFVALAGPEKTGAELLFLLPFASIICANYIEARENPKSSEKDISEFWFKEIQLWLVVLLPVLMLFI